MKHTPLKLLPVSDETKAYLLDHADDIDGAVLYRAASADEDTKVAVYGAGCSSHTYLELLSRHPTAFAWWNRADENAAGSLVERAILEVNKGATPYAAARKVGVNVSAVYRAIKRRDARGVCPHCGQLLPKEST